MIYDTIFIVIFGAIIIGNICLMNWFVDQANDTTTEYDEYKQQIVEISEVGPMGN